MDDSYRDDYEIDSKFGEDFKRKYPISPVKRKRAGTK